MFIVLPNEKEALREKVIELSQHIAKLELRLKEMHELVWDLAEHEGAEGFSEGLREKIEQYSNDWFDEEGNVK